MVSEEYSFENCMGEGACNTQESRINVQQGCKGRAYRKYCREGPLVFRVHCVTTGKEYSIAPCVIQPSPLQAWRVHIFRDFQHRLLLTHCVHQYLHHIIVLWPVRQHQPACPHPVHTSPHLSTPPRHTWCTTSCATSLTVSTCASACLNGSAVVGTAPDETAEVWETLGGDHAAGEDGLWWAVLYSDCMAGGNGEQAI